MANKKKLLGYINVSGKPYAIYLCDLAGDCEHESWAGKAYIEDGIILVNQDNSKQDIQKTIWHEVCHAWFARSGFKQVIGHDTEEIIVESLSNFLFDLIGRAPISASQKLPKKPKIRPGIK